MTETSRKKILIADDEEEILKTLAHMLGRKGYEVITAVNGEEAIEKMRQTVPDLLILDLMMPEMDGASLAFNMEETKSLSSLPIIFVSGIISKDVEKQFDSTGRPIRYLSKPVDIEKLFSLIETLLPS